MEFSNIFIIASQIFEIVKTVKANKEQCSLLSERVHIVDNILKRIKKSDKDVPTIDEGMTFTEKTLRACLKFIEEFTKETWWQRVFGYSANKEQFAELNDNLQKCVNQFTLAIVVDSNLQQRIDKTFDPEKDIKAIAIDREALAGMQDLILQLHQKEQQKLEEIYTLEQQRQSDDKLRDVEAKRKAEFLQEKMQAIEVALRNITQPGLAVAISVLPVADNLIINFTDLYAMGVIGDGKTATVYAGKLFSSDVAIKKLKKPDDKSRANLFQEAQLLSNLKGENFIRCYGVVIEAGRECLVMELMQGGSLSKYLRDPQKLISINLQRQWALEIARGLNSLHKQKILYGDLKTTNILLSKDKRAKLADFDTTHRIDKIDRISGAEDLLKYGDVLWEIFTRTEAPFSRNPQLLIEIVEPFKTIISKCWSEDPNSRPTAEEIVSQIEPYHPINEFLGHVVNSAAEQVKKMLKADPILATLQGSVEDHVGRRFVDITGLQLALWCLDSRLSRIISTRLSPEEAGRQVTTYENGSWIEEHGENLDISQLTAAYKTYLQNFNTSYEVCERNWLGVGKAQKQLSIAILIEYCQFNMPQSPQGIRTKFVNSLPEVINLCQLGVTYSIFHGNQPEISVEQPSRKSANGKYRPMPGYV